MTGNRAKSRGQRAKGEEQRAKSKGQRAESKEREFYASSCSMPPEFVAIGHFTHDVAECGLVLGGAAAYSSIAARELGLRVGVVSAVGKDFLHYDKFDGISLTLVRANADAGKAVPTGNLTTTFQNIYEGDVRRQIIKSISAPIYPEHIPPEWLDAEIVYLCPVADELDPSIVHRFPNSLIGVSPQGWMRQWNERGLVSPREWKDAPDVLPYVKAVIMSEEDISPFPNIVREYADLTDIVVLTRGENGSRLFHDGQVTSFPAFSTSVVDPTGAGDVFAAAFLSKFYQTRDLYKASVFANCAASFVVEKPGTTGIPCLNRVCSRMMSHLANS